MEHGYQAYDNLNQEYLVFLFGDLGSFCKRQSDETEVGDTISLRKECFIVDETKRSLEFKLEKVRQEVRYWQDCYEILL